PEELSGSDAQFVLTAPDGTQYGVSFGTGTSEVRFTDGVRWRVSDAGIAASNGDAVEFRTDDAGRIARVTLPDGREIAYNYDAAGDLFYARNLALAQSTRYGYAADDPHRLDLVTGDLGAGGSVIEYDGTPAATPLTADLGGSLNYLTQPFTGTLAAGATHRYSLAIRSSEVVSSGSDAVYLGVVVEAEAGSTLAPALPQIAGSTPIASRTEASRAFALYRIDRAALEVLEIAGANGATAGAYSLRLFIAGDANRDGRVDGLDTQALNAAFGASTGQPSFNANADFNLDGAVNTLDRQLLAQSF